jgi:hypothetical protein
MKYALNKKLFFYLDFGVFFDKAKLSNRLAFSYLNGDETPTKFSFKLKIKERNLK